MANNQEQFDRLFGKKAPVESLLTFRVIGIAPDPPSYNASVVSSLISSLVSSNLGMGQASWYTPLEIAPQQPVVSQLFNAGTATPSGTMAGMSSYYVELDSSANAKRFIKEQTCQPDFAAFSEPGKDPFAACAAQGKYFGYAPFGSNSVALDSVKEGFSKFFGYAALGVALIAAIIMTICEPFQAKMIGTLRGVPSLAT